MLLYFLQGMSLGFSGAASPGPFQAFLIGRTLQIGWRRALPAVLAPLISDGPIIALMLLLLTNLPGSVLRAIQVVGGLYVLRLAWKSWQAYRAFQPQALEPPPDAARQSLWQGVLMNFLSPGPYLFWSLLAGPVLVRGWREAPPNGIIFLVGFYGAMVGGLTLLVVLFGAARQMGPRVNRAMIGFSALALAGFGLYQLVRGILGGPL